MYSHESNLRRRRTSVAVLVCVLAATCAAAADAQEVVDEHAAHRAASAAVKVERAAYDVPDVTLQNERGDSIKLQQLLAGPQPVVINFIFTSCTTICPVMTATLSQLQRELSGVQPAPRYVSISIDPDYDNAAVLREYAARYHADWTFLTGERALILRVLKSFDAWRGSKGNHLAITLFRRADESEWLRVEGLSSAKELAHLLLHGAG